MNDVRALPCYLVIIPHQVHGLLVLSEPLDGGADLVGQYVENKVAPLSAS